MTRSTETASGRSFILLFTQILFLSWMLLFFSSSQAAGTSLPETVKKVKPSVVAVGTFHPTRSPRASFKGTGFVVNAEGYVLTNHHVVAHADRVFIAFRDGTRREGEVVGYEKETDLAVIRVKLPEGEPLRSMA